MVISTKERIFSLCSRKAKKPFTIKDLNFAKPFDLGPPITSTYSLLKNWRKTLTSWSWSCFRSLFLQESWRAWIRNQHGLYAPAHQSEYFHCVCPWSAKCSKEENNQPNFLWNCCELFLPALGVSFYLLFGPISGLKWNLEGSSGKGLFVLRILSLFCLLRLNLSLFKPDHRFHLWLLCWKVSAISSNRDPRRCLWTCTSTEKRTTPA